MIGDYNKILVGVYPNRGGLNPSRLHLPIAWSKPEGQTIAQVINRTNQRERGFLLQQHTHIADSIVAGDGAIGLRGTGDGIGQPVRVP